MLDTELDKDAAAVLGIMQGWQWSYYDPDGGYHHRTKELSLVANLLAMDGISRPHVALLTLLSKGELSALADFRWQKYEGGHHYYLEGTSETLKPKRWLTLSNLIDDERRTIQEGNFLLDHVKLTKIGQGECYPYSWEVGNNSFSTSLCPPDTPAHSASYYEEWFSAWNIEVWPVQQPWEGVEIDSTPQPAAIPKSAGGAPRKWNWDGALLHLAALAHHTPDGLFRSDGTDPNQSDIARHLETWFVATTGSSPENSQLRDYGKRFVTELNALKLKAANNS